MVGRKNDLTFVGAVSGAVKRCEMTSIRERHERIIADYVNGLRGEMSQESAAELYDAILAEQKELWRHNSVWQGLVQHIIDGGS